MTDDEKKNISKGNSKAIYPYISTDDNTRRWYNGSFVIKTGKPDNVRGSTFTKFGPFRYDL